jgi:hypothetical protein
MCVFHIPFADDSLAFKQYTQDTKTGLYKDEDTFQFE